MKLITKIAQLSPIQQSRLEKEKRNQTFVWLGNSNEQIYKVQNFNKN